MPYRHDGQGMGGGPIPEKTVGFMWGYLWGFGSALVIGAVWFVISQYQ